MCIPFDVVSIRKQSESVLLLLRSSKTVLLTLRLKFKHVQKQLFTTRCCQDRTYSFLMTNYKSPTPLTTFMTTWLRTTFSGNLLASEGPFIGSFTFWSIHLKKRSNVVCFYFFVHKKMWFILCMQMWKMSVWCAWFGYVYFFILFSTSKGYGLGFANCDGCTGDFVKTQDSGSILIFLSFSICESSRFHKFPHAPLPIGNCCA